METVRLGVIMNGVTGRMGTHQHLVRSICAIREQGGVPLDDGTRDRARSRSWSAATPTSCAALAEAHGGLRWTTDLDAALADAAEPHLLRRRRSPGAGGAGPQGRSTPASTSTPRSRTADTAGGRARPGPPRRRRRRQARRGAGQAVPAGPAASSSG